jgi:ribosomal protein S12 methylthiotransferase
VYERNELLSFPGSAYLKISEGATIGAPTAPIPLIRGALRSKPMQVILAEAKDLIGRGSRRST